MTHLALIIFLLGSTAVETQTKGGLENEFVQLLPGRQAELRRNCMVSLMARFFMESGGSKVSRT